MSALQLHRLAAMQCIKRSVCGAMSICDFSKELCKSSQKTDAINNEIRVIF
jgi:hypothetical protein